MTSGFNLTVDGLADDVLVHIFSYLNVKDKCKAVQVCRRWNTLAHQKSLWKHIDLTPFKVDLKSIWKLLRSYFTDRTLSLHLHGFTESIRTTECISNAVLTDIKNRCPNMRELHITKANLNKIDSSLLPRALRRLTLHKCMLTVRWFQPAVEASILRNLETLDLRGSTRTDNVTVKDIAEFESLKSVDLSGCYRIGEPGIATLTEKLKCVEELRLSDCDIDDQCLHHVGRHLKNLKIINLDNCSRITDLGVGSLSSLSNLVSLNISCCDVTSRGISNFVAVVPRLERLVLNSQQQSGFKVNIEQLESIKSGLRIELS